MIWKDQRRAGSKAASRQCQGAEEETEDKKFCNSHAERNIDWPLRRLSKSSRTEPDGNTCPQVLKPTLKSKNMLSW